MKVQITEEQYVNILMKECGLLNEEMFSFYDLTPDERHTAYELFKTSYEKSTGSSWSESKFQNKASQWTFFGIKNKGFIAARKQSSGDYKLTGSAGDIRSIFLGGKEISDLAAPFWGMATDEIIDMLTRKFGFLTPPAVLVKKLFPMIPPAEFGYAETKINDDGSVTFGYEDVGTHTKRFFGNKLYFKQLQGLIGMISGSLNPEEKEELDNFFNTI
jgi:hypothetical protein